MWHKCKSSFFAGWFPPPPPDTTQNEKLLSDELYLGLRQKRVGGEEYDAFVDTFVRACQRRYPNAYIHFEDFGLGNARRILDRYQPMMACFNDDVQGTGAVTLAAIMAAFKVGKVDWNNARFVMFGAGTAGTGIADQVSDAIVEQTGKSKEEAGRQIWCVDRHEFIWCRAKNCTGVSISQGFC